MRNSDSGQSPREQSKAISDGDSKPHHIGKMSFEVLQQEIVSLRNTKPMFRNNKWKKRAQTVQEGINILTEKDKVKGKALSELLRAVLSGET